MRADATVRLSDARRAAAATRLRRAIDRLVHPADLIEPVRRTRCANAPHDAWHSTAPHVAGHRPQPEPSPMGSDPPLRAQSSGRGTGRALNQARLQRFFAPGGRLGMGTVGPARTALQGVRAPAFYGCEASGQPASGDPVSNNLGSRRIGFPRWRSTCVSSPRYRHAPSCARWRSWVSRRRASGPKHEWSPATLPIRLAPQSLAQRCG